MVPSSPVKRSAAPVPPPPPPPEKINLTIVKATKLQRSPQMAKLYRHLRDKLEIIRASNDSRGDTSDYAREIADAIVKRYIFSSRSFVLSGVLLIWVYELTETYFKH